MKSHFLNKAARLLEKRPLIVGTLTGQGLLQNQIRTARSSSIDLLEVRLDTFSFLSKDLVKSLRLARKLLFDVKKSTRLPILLTLRSHKETGADIPSKRRFDDQWRWNILKELIPMADVVDGEAMAHPLARKVSLLARRNHVSVILSHHNFKGVPSSAILKRLQRRSAALKADVLKVAVTPRTDEELRSFLRWGGRLKKPRPVLIGMGPLGFISRFIGYTFGSILTYGHLGKSAAPGQISARDLVKSIHSIYA